MNNTVVGKTLLTIEIVETVKAGFYSVHAFNGDGVQIGQIPCSARAGRVVSTVSDLVVNAGLTGSLPLIGIDDFQRADVAMEDAPVSRDRPRGKDTVEEGPGFGDMVENLANFLRKNGAK